MDLRERLFGPIKTRSESDGAEVDVGAVVRRLLLFDEYTMESSSLTELPAFINAFGIDGVMKLVAYTHFRIAIPQWLAFHDWAEMLHPCVQIGMMWTREVQSVFNQSESELNRS